MFKHGESAGSPEVYPVYHELTDLAFKRVRLATELRQALAHGELRAYYQPVYALDDHLLIGVEALVRWQHPQRGLIPPGDFLPVAEDSGLIAAIDAGLVRALDERREDARIVLGFDQGRRRAWLHEAGVVVDEAETPDGWRLQLRWTPRQRAAFEAL